MKNLTQNEVIKITEFCQKMANNASKTLFERLDQDVYKKINLKVTDVDEIKDLAEYKRNNIFFISDYAKEDVSGALAMLIPEELAAELSDVMMGGNGVNCYNGTLTE